MSYATMKASDVAVLCRAILDDIKQDTDKRRAHYFQTYADKRNKSIMGWIDRHVFGGDPFTVRDAEAILTEPLGLDSALDACVFDRFVGKHDKQRERVEQLLAMVCDSGIEEIQVSPDDYQAITKMGGAS